MRGSAGHLEDQASKKSTIARDRARGVAHELTTSDAAPPTDQALVDKVRSEVLAGPEWRACTINIDAAEGAVALRGEVTRPEQVKQLEAAVAQVPGVRTVDNFVHPPGTQPENIREAVEASDQARRAR